MRTLVEKGDDVMALALKGDQADASIPEGSKVFFDAL